jgi:riboflavin synthase alpha subunit
MSSSLVHSFTAFRQILSGHRVIFDFWSKFGGIHHRKHEGNEGQNRANSSSEKISKYLIKKGFYKFPAL